MATGSNPTHCEDPLGSHFENENNLESDKSQQPFPQITLFTRPSNTQNQRPSTTNNSNQLYEVQKGPSLTPIQILNDPTKQQPEHRPRRDHRDKRPQNHTPQHSH
ncbi:hypothetical protein TNCV_3826671 [Trichonephila clavipes]|nr:hypothetical protein TNCV_3826671 [Trichonephila clavipes]